MLSNLRGPRDDSARRSSSRWLLGGSALAALVITASACGSGGTKTAAVTITTTTTVAGRAAALQPFIDCMQKQGVKIDGRGFRGGAGAPGDSTGSVPSGTAPGGTAPARSAPSTTLPPGVSQQKYDAAIAACRSLIPARTNNNANNPAVAAYRNCLNLQLEQHGVTTLPPVGQGAGAFGGGAFGGGAFGGGAGNGGTTATTNPALAAAMQACAALRPAPTGTSTTRPATTS